MKEMKTLKISTLLVALASVFTFSSCLDNGNDNYGNRFRSYVTITGDNSFGYTFHDDVGCKLFPTSASIQSVLPGLPGSNVKRAYVAFELVNDETTTQLLAGKSYEIKLVNDYYANYTLPTFTSVRRNENLAGTEADTLVTQNNGRISSINSSIWAINGYVNASMVIDWDGNSNPILRTYYNASDVDALNNTLTLNLYYNAKTENTYTQAQSVFSFDLPEEVYNSYQTDEITLILKAKQSNGLGSNDTKMSEVGRCKLALKDLFQPTNY